MNEPASLGINVCPYVCPPLYLFERNKETLSYSSLKIVSFSFMLQFRKVASYCKVMQGLTHFLSSPRLREFSYD